MSFTGQLTMPTSSPEREAITRGVLETCREVVGLQVFRRHTFPAMVRRLDAWQHMGRLMQADVWLATGDLFIFNVLFGEGTFEVLKVYDYKGL